MEPDNRADVIARLEAFFKTHDPAGYGWEDAPHVHYMENCAFKLIELHAADRNMPGVKKYADWLEKHFKEEKNGKPSENKKAE